MAKTKYFVKKGSKMAESSLSSSSDWSSSIMLTFTCFVIAFNLVDLSIVDSKNLCVGFSLSLSSIYIKRCVGGWVCNAFLKPGNISSIPVQITPNLKPLVTETLLTLCLPPPIHPVFNPPYCLFLLSQVFQAGF